LLIADIDFCVPEDAGQLFSIEAACFEQPWDRRVIEHDLADMGQVVYMKATLAGRIAGYGVLGRAGRAAHLMNIAVHPDYRSRCVGLQLMTAFDEIAREWGCGRMRLEVRSTNARARDFYVKLGFACIRTERNYYAGGEDAIIMVARLPLQVK
jgi:ribosomal-protein-alanine N-acetyltransferase